MLFSFLASATLAFESGRMSPNGGRARLPKRLDSAQAFEIILPRRGKLSCDSFLIFYDLVNFSLLLLAGPIILWSSFGARSVGSAGFAASFATGSRVQP